MISWLKEQIAKVKGERIEKTEVVHMLGHKFTVLNPLTLPKVRAIALHSTIFENDLNLTKVDLRLFLNVIKEKLEFPLYSKKDNINKESVEFLGNTMAKQARAIADAKELVNTLDLVVQNDYAMTPMIKSACHTILIDNEDPADISGAAYKKKLDLCRDHPEVEAFFLRIILSSMTNILNLSQDLKYLESLKKGIKKTEEVAYSKIGKTLYETGSTKKTTK